MRGQLVILRGPGAGQVGVPKLRLRWGKTRVGGLLIPLHGLTLIPRDTTAQTQALPKLEHRLDLALIGRSSKPCGRLGFVPVYAYPRFVFGSHRALGLR